MVIWVSVAVFLAVAVGFMFYDLLVLGGCPTVMRFLIRSWRL